MSALLKQYPSCHSLLLESLRLAEIQAQLLNLGRCKPNISSMSVFRILFTFRLFNLENMFSLAICITP